MCHKIKPKQRMYINAAFRFINIETWLFKFHWILNFLPGTYIFKSNKLIKVNIPA